MKQNCRHAAEGGGQRAANDRLQTWKLWTRRPRILGGSTMGRQNTWTFGECHISNPYSTLSNLRERTGFISFAIHLKPELSFIPRLSGGPSRDVMERRDRVPRPRTWGSDNEGAALEFVSRSLFSSSLPHKFISQSDVNDSYSFLLSSWVITRRF